MTPTPPAPEPIDDYDRDNRTRQGNPESMRCRLCNGARVLRRIRYPSGGFEYVRYCPTCDHINRRN